MVVMQTSLGTIEIELFADDAPGTVQNFLEYVDAGFYDGTIFHRVIAGFMVQGGGMSADMKERKTRAPIQNEAKNGQKNARGTLAMARTSDVNSATAQFFINLSDNAFLDHGSRDYGYTVFGRIARGMEVIDRIAGVETGRKGLHDDVPVDPVLIEQVTRA